MKAFLHLSCLLFFKKSASQTIDIYQKVSSNESRPTFTYSTNLKNQSSNANGLQILCDPSRPCSYGSRPNVINNTTDGNEFSKHYESEVPDATKPFYSDITLSSFHSKNQKLAAQVFPLSFNT